MSALAEAVGPDRFRTALSRWPSGVTVVTARGPDGPLGVTASSFTSLSLSPPLVLVCVKQASGIHTHLVDAEHFVVHVLAEHQHELSRRFAMPGDRFAGITVEPGPAGVPLLPLGAARLHCRRHEAHRAGDHTILIGEVLDAEVTDHPPVVYWKGAYRRVVDHPAAG